MRNSAYGIASLGKIIMGFFQWFSMVALRKELQQIYEGNNSKCEEIATLVIASILSVLFSIAMFYLDIKD